MTRATVLKQLPIKPSDFVVEIGAGPTPFRYTKLIIEKYPFDNIERHDDTVNIAPVIKGDAVNLPLADNSCDVLFVSHVIEHLQNPEAFIKEAKRCAKYLYLEFPTIRRELMYGWSFHRWLVEIENKRLVFYKNDIPQFFDDFFHRNYDFLLDVWSEKRFMDLNRYLYINTDDLEYIISTKTALEYILEISSKGDNKINYENPYGQTGCGTVKYPLSTRFKVMIWLMTPNSLIQFRNRLVRWRNRSNRRKLTNEIIKRLICLKCRNGQLQMERYFSVEEIICKSCGQRYRVKDDVFDFDIK